MPSILAALSLTAVAWGAHGIAETLKRVPTKGEKAVYDVRAEFSLQGQTVVYSGVNTNEVITAEDTGAYTMVTTVSDAKIEFGGDSFPAPGSTTTRSYGPDGLVTATDGENVTGETRRLANLSLVAWPKDPVEVGGTWTVMIPGKGSEGTVAVEATFTLVAMEEVSGRRVAKLAVKNRETGGSDPASSEATVWVDAATGMLVKSEQTVKNAPLAGQIVDAKVTATLRP